MLPSSSPGLTQLDVLVWGHFKTQVTQNRPIARLWELCKCVTHAFGWVRGTETVRNAETVTKKYRNFGSFLRCKSRRKSSGVVYPEKKKNESETETNSPFIFRTTLIFQNRCGFYLSSLKRWKSNRRSTNGYKQTISTLQKPNKEKTPCSLFCSYLKEKIKANKKCSPIPQNVFLFNQNDLKPKLYLIFSLLKPQQVDKRTARFGHPNVNSHCPYNSLSVDKVKKIPVVY